MKQITRKQWKEYIKRYEKLKNNNLPTPFWNEDSLSEEYVYFRNYYYQDGTKSKDLEINMSLFDPLSDVAGTQVYYPYNTKCFYEVEENGKKVIKVKRVSSEYAHSHNFDGVLRELYKFPETFSISKEDEEYYSKQELRFLKRIQKYLLFIGLKDLETPRIPVSRYRNHKRTKYEGAYTRIYDDIEINDALSGKRNFVVRECRPDYTKNSFFDPKEYTVLVVDSNCDYRMYIEYTKILVQTYKDIKDKYTDSSLKDDDKVRVWYFNILEVFDTDK